MGWKYPPPVDHTKEPDVFGHIAGVPVGSVFYDRWWLHNYAVHREQVAGICGDRTHGCYSVVLSGRYEDDMDEGEELIYVGSGGRAADEDGTKPITGRQSCDQVWSGRFNASLRVSAATKKPVRVIRGASTHPTFAPVKGYRFDGLYEVEQAWMEGGKRGYNVCKFRLKRLPNQPPLTRWVAPPDYTGWPAPLYFGPPAFAAVCMSARLPRASTRRGRRRTASAPVDGAEGNPKKPAAIVGAGAGAAEPIPPTTNAAATRGVRRGLARAQVKTHSEVAPVYMVEASSRM